MGAIFSKTEKQNILETDYVNGQYVSFKKNDKNITAQINSFTCHISSDRMCDLNQSFLQVIDEDGNLHIVSLTEVQKANKDITTVDASKYSPGKDVLFYTFKEKSTLENEKVVTNKGKIVSKEIIRSSNKDVINDKSSLTVKLDNGFEKSIPFNQPGLQLIEVSLTDTTVDKAKEQYPIGSTVTFQLDGVLTTGTITGYDIPPQYISENDKVLISIKQNGTNVTKEVLFKDLKLVPETYSGKQKYTLENDKYRVKYAKYKAKYLAQKN